MPQPPDPVIVEVPRKETTLILPHLRCVLDACMAAMGYGWRPGSPPQYRPSYDDNDITIDVAEPLRARIVGKWVPNTLPYRMHFYCDELQCSIPPGGHPGHSNWPVVPLGYSSPGPVINVGEILRAEIPREPQPRERVIDLD